MEVRPGNFSRSYFCSSNTLFWSIACWFACIWASWEAVFIAWHSWHHYPHGSLPNLPYLWHLWLPFKYQSALLVLLWFIYIKLLLATRKLKTWPIKYLICCFISQRNQQHCYLLKLIRNADFRATPHTSRIIIRTWTKIHQESHIHTIVCQVTTSYLPRTWMLFFQRRIRNKCTCIFEMSLSSASFLVHLFNDTMDSVHLIRMEGKLWQAGRRKTCSAWWKKIGDPSQGSPLSVPWGVVSLTLYRNDNRWALFLFGVENMVEEAALAGALKQCKF